MKPLEAICFFQTLFRLSSKGRSRLLCALSLPSLVTEYMRQPYCPLSPVSSDLSMSTLARRLTLLLPSQRGSPPTRANTQISRGSLTCRYSLSWMGTLTSRSTKPAASAVGDWGGLYSLTRRAKDSWQLREGSRALMCLITSIHEYLVFWLKIIEISPPAVNFSQCGYLDQQGCYNINKVVLMSLFYQTKPKEQYPGLAKPANAQPPQVPDRLPLDQNLEYSQPMFPVIAASSHPLIALLHIGLKIAVVVVYVIFPIFSASFFVKEVVVVLAAVDFWIVKNVSGRLLVGLRWWVDFQENGDQKWQFECKVDENNVNPADDKVFWWTLALFTLVWLILGVVNVIALNITNVVICLFCLAMTGFNLYSYYKCSQAQAENVKKLALQYGAGMAAKFLAGSIISKYI